MLKAATKKTVSSKIKRPANSSAVPCSKSFVISIQILNFKIQLSIQKYILYSFLFFVLPFCLLVSSQHVRHKVSHGVPHQIWCHGISSVWPESEIKAEANKVLSSCCLDRLERARTKRQISCNAYSITYQTAFFKIFGSRLTNQQKTYNECGICSVGRFKKVTHFVVFCGLS